MCRRTAGGGRASVKDAMGDVVGSIVERVVCEVFIVCDLNVVG